MIKTINGIEGDDIPYHLSLLEYNVGQLNNRLFFFPLNDHYNTHGPDWLEKITRQAKLSKTVVFYDLVNIGDYEHAKFCDFVANYDHPNKVWLTVNQKHDFKIAGVKIVPWDFMWNRTRAYYTEKIPEDLHLHHYARGHYNLPELNFEKRRSRWFMSLTGRDYGYRKPLHDFVRHYNGYASNRSQGEYLEDDPVVGVYTPVPNEFYLDSYFSIYVESNCLRSDLIHITEKTFEPLLKGHFILPFSNPGTIARLIKLGFLFPDFIDYSFDNELDPAKRFDMVKHEFLRLMDLDLPTLYADNWHILTHNQRCIRTIPYDTHILGLF